MEQIASTKKGRIADYTQYLNGVARKRIPPMSTKHMGYLKVTPASSQISMFGGSPNDLHFPVTEAKFTSSDGSEIRICPDEMKTCLQYGCHTGLQPLRVWVEGLYKRVHNPPTMDDKQLPSSLALQICSGGKEGLSKAFGTLLEDGDNFLGEEAIYQFLFPTFIPHGIKGIPIRSDKEGMDAGHLRQVMSEWEEATQGRRPRLMYVIPTCSNPTGRTWSDRRKREIYDVAREFDLLIIEDDPYYYLQFQKPLSPSLLSLDTDGRVIRADSFSKSISPGCRVGILFGPTQIIDKIQMAVFPDTGGSSGLSQMFIYKVVQSWGYDGFLQHNDKLAVFYKQRAEKTVELVSKYLTGLCEWQNPDGGMFMWLKLLGVDNSVSVVEDLMEKGVFFMDGSVFTMDRTPTPYVRLCFSRASDENMDKAISLLADVMKEVTQDT